MKAANQLDVTRHPRTEELLAYADGELPEVFVPALERHLAACAECRDLIEDYREPASVAAAEAWPSAADKEAAWQRLQASMASPSLVAAPAPVVAANANGLPGAPANLVEASEPAKVVAFPPAGSRAAQRLGWQVVVPWAACALLSMVVYWQLGRIDNLLTQPRLVNSITISADQQRSDGAKRFRLGEDGTTLFVKIAADSVATPVTLEISGPLQQPLTPKHVEKNGLVSVLLPADFPPGVYRVRILDRELVECETIDFEVLAAER